jgi:hypothetical protein
LSVNGLLNPAFTTGNSHTGKAGAHNINYTLLCNIFFWKFGLPPQFFEKCPVEPGQILSNLKEENQAFKTANRPGRLTPCAKSNCYPRVGIVVPKGCYPVAFVLG